MQTALLALVGTATYMMVVNVHEKRVQGASSVKHGTYFSEHVKELRGIGDCAQCLEGIFLVSVSTLYNTKGDYIPYLADYMFERYARHRLIQFIDVVRSMHTDQR
jgi:hypothetical protein